MNARLCRLRLFLLVLAAALALLLPAGCIVQPPAKLTAPQALREVPDGDWPLLLDDLSAKSLFEAAEASLAYLRKINPDKLFTFGPYRASAGQMAASLERVKDLLYRLPDPSQRSQALKREFILLESVGSDGQGRVLFTGYYEPILKAQAQPQAPFTHPVYAIPSDLVYINLKDFNPELPNRRLVGQVQGRRVRPYPDRKAIDFQRALAGRAEVLGYVADPVEVFFLHIQGSGQLEFEDGRRLRVGYAASNGQPYRSIGRFLLQEGLMEPGSMSMQGIKAFLAAHPQQMQRVLSHNPSYVFFRPLAPTGGPLGCFEAPLTAGRSVALDRRLFPGLALGYVQGQMPAAGGGAAPLNRFVFNQDTGGAIRGPGRLDMFFGSGAEAGELAGRMNYPGRLFFFFPRNP
ncbi:MAG: transglycosylase [Desulfarculus sp.]|jgi:membrane-bound lytic murein transglycosylase A|nr:MAG: transglycosylase [Desulfarculus sp.]